MPGRPNVVVFFTDQQRHDTSGLHGCPLDLTPNFDAWAKRGTHLANSITPQPVCGPARACLQTGRFASAIDSVNEGDGCQLNGNVPLPETDMMARHFATAGYATGYFGKWHLSPHGDGAVPEPFRGGYQTWLAANCVEITSDAYDTVLYDENDDAVRLPGYRVDAVTDAGIRFIDQQARADQPFLCMISHLEPHMQNHRDDHPGPVMHNERYQGRWTPPDLAALRGIGEPVEHLIGGNAQQSLAGYYAMCKRLDDAFGRLMDALISLGQLENTIVVFASDHACHFRTRNKEYKRSLHDASVRTPGLIHGGPFTGGGRFDKPFQLTDIAPTLLDAAGVEPLAEAQGRSLVPVVNRQPDADWPDDAFIQISESTFDRALRTRRWKYGITAVDATPRDRHATAFHESFLYDLASDPYELMNLVNSDPHAEVREQLRDRLLQRMAEAGEPAATVSEHAGNVPPPSQHFQRELRQSDDCLSVE
jgi:arylsulfatase A-like enzyme